MDATPLNKNRHFFTSSFTLPRLAPAFFAAACVFFLAPPTGHAQVGSGGAIWATNAQNANWFDVTQWMLAGGDPGAVPNGIDAVAILWGDSNTNDTNFANGGVTANRAIDLNGDIILGTLIWGDNQGGQQIDLNGQMADDSAPGLATITMRTDPTLGTGDGRAAAIIHRTGEGPLDSGVFGITTIDGTTTHPISNQADGNGNDDADANVNWTIADADGLFVDAFQNLILNGRVTGNDGTGTRNNLTKGEDANLIIGGALTDIDTLRVRDGSVQLNLGGNNDNPASAADFDVDTVILGAASGDANAGTRPGGDLGANPLNTGAGTEVEPHEGSANDRTVPRFFLNDLIEGVGTTYDTDYEINGGIFQIDNNRLATAGPGTVTHTGTITLNASEDDFLLRLLRQNGAGEQPEHVFDGTTGGFTGAGGLAKTDTAQLVFTGDHDFTGTLQINDQADDNTGLNGGVEIRGDGNLSGVGRINLTRRGTLNIDYTANQSEKLNDAVDLWSDNTNRVEIESADVTASETIGDVRVLQGVNNFEINTGATGAFTLNIDQLRRDPGGVINFNANAVNETIFNSGGAITVNVADQTQLGTVTDANGKEIVIGVFTGDGVVEAVAQLPNKAGEFTYFDGNTLRTLDPNSAADMLQVPDASALTAAAGLNQAINFKPPETTVAAATGSATNALTESVTAAAVRYAAVDGGGNVGNNEGSGLFINDGVTLTSQSGMFVSNRNGGTGDLNSGENHIVFGGTVDLDGTADDKEAIIVNNSGQNLFFRGTTIEARNGLIKTGRQEVFLEGENNLGGSVVVTEGALRLRNNSALRGATDYRLVGEAVLNLEQGVIIDGVDFIVDLADVSRDHLHTVNDHNIWDGDIIINNITDFDQDGNAEDINRNEFRLVTDSEGSLTIAGDIYSVPNATAKLDADILYQDARTVNTNGSGTGIINLFGQFSDRAPGTGFDAGLGGGPSGVYNPNTRFTTTNPLNGNTDIIEDGDLNDRGANANDVLRFEVDGNDQLLVNIIQQWDSAGAFFTERGTVRLAFDPAATRTSDEAPGQFFTSEAARVNDSLNVNGRFWIGEGTANNEQTTLLLTRDGQYLNTSAVQIRNDANAAGRHTTVGLEHFGGADATVDIGDDGHTMANGNDAANNRFGDEGGANTHRWTLENANGGSTLRLYSHDGYNTAGGTATNGRVNFHGSIRGANSTLVKAGTGDFWIDQNQGGAEANQIDNFILRAGELAITRRNNLTQKAINSATGDNVDFTLAGGDFRLTDVRNYDDFATGGNHSDTSATANAEEQAAGNFTAQSGDSRFEVEVANANGARQVVLANAGVVSQVNGATVAFVESGLGTSRISIGAGATAGAHTSLTPGSGDDVFDSRIGGWAVFGTNSASASGWAGLDAVDAVGVAESDVGEYIHAAGEQDTFGAGLNTNLTVSPAALVADTTTNSIRINPAAAAGISIDAGGNVLTLDDGGFLVPGANANANAITNGTLAGGAEGELLIHNYGGADGGDIYNTADADALTISTVIADPAAGGTTGVTYAGTGITNVTGTNTYTGDTFINGSSVVIDAIEALGSISVGGAFSAAASTGGTGFAVDDTINVSGLGGTGAVLTVAAVGGAGEITGLAVTDAGAGFNMLGALSIDSTSGGGSGATIDLTALDFNDISLFGGELVLTTGITFDASRTFVLGGDGGTIKTNTGTISVVNGEIVGEGNLIAEGDPTEATGLGDLIKTGQGELVLANNAEAANAWTGALDIREGTFRITATGDNTLGQDHSFVDGVIVRDGATLALGADDASTGVNIQIEDHVILEGGATVENENGSGFRNHRLDGIVQLVGSGDPGNPAVANFLVSGDEMLLNNDGGFIVGGPDTQIRKDGGGSLRFKENNAGFLGSLLVEDGTVFLENSTGNALPNASGIILGRDEAANTNEEGTVQLLYRSDDAVGKEHEVSQDITVLGDSNTMRIGTIFTDHNEVVTYSGNLDLSGFATADDPNEELEIFNRGNVNNQRGGEGVADIGNLGTPGDNNIREEYYTNIAGNILGSGKRIRVYQQQGQNVGGNGGTFDTSVAPNTDLDQYHLVTLSGDNSAFSGRIEVGNRSDNGPVQGSDPQLEGPDLDKQHWLRFGDNTGAATSASNAGVDILLRHNATLQAFGSEVTIGNLLTDGDPNGGATGNNNPTTEDFTATGPATAFIENGGTNPGRFIIAQTADQLVDAVFRDGTFYSASEADVASPSLGVSILSTTATPTDLGANLQLNQTNTHSGDTIVNAGALTIVENGGTGTIVNSNIIVNDDGGTELAILAGHDSSPLDGIQLAQQDVTVRDDGFILAGALPGNAVTAADSTIGSFTIGGDLVLTGSAIFQGTTTDGLGGTPGSDYDQIITGGDLILNGTLVALDDIGPNGTNTWTPASGDQFDFFDFTNRTGTSITPTGVSITGDAGFFDLPDLTGVLETSTQLVWFFDMFDSQGIVRVDLIPEPSSTLLLMLACGLGLLRRRRP